MVNQRPIVNPIGRRLRFSLCLEGCYDAANSPRSELPSMSRMRLKTKLVLAISSMVFALVAIFCYLYVSHLVRQRTAEAYDSADFVAKEIRDERA